MRTTVIVTKRGEGYIATVGAKVGIVRQGVRVGLTPAEAAASAAELMIRYAQPNAEGGDLMAPLEVLELVPTHLRGMLGG